MTAKRGRPKGDGRDDESALKAIAVAIGSGATYDQAVASVYPTHKPAYHHQTKTVKDRWRRKWTERSQEFLAEARTPIVRHVYGPGQDRLMPNRGEILNQYFRQNPADQLKTVLEYTGMTPDQFVAQQKEFAERLRDPMIRDALARIRSGEVHSALALYRKFQS